MEEFRESGTAGQAGLGYDQLQVEHGEGEGVEPQLDEGLHQHVQIVQSQPLMHVGPHIQSVPVLTIYVPTGFWMLVLLRLPESSFSCKYCSN